MNFHDRAQRLWRTAQTPVPNGEVARMLRSQARFMAKKAQSEEVNEQGLEQLAMAERVYRDDARDVERGGTYPITELLR